MYTIVETMIFIRSAKKFEVTENEIDEIKMFLAMNPHSGVLIQGTGGARKLRFAAKGKGKSGGYRIITFTQDEKGRVHLLNIYDKTKKSDLTSVEKRKIKDEIRTIGEDEKGGHHE